MMKMTGLFLKTAVMAGVAGLLMVVAVMGQADKGDSAAQPKAQTTVKQLKPQSTCPVMGGDIDKSLYVDYKGKRIYVCCEGCVAKLKKNPEKYLKKLEKMGQTPVDVPQEKAN
jgi:YHS domain-containing protein